jgi:hypothetical protein
MPLFNELEVANAAMVNIMNQSTKDQTELSQRIGSDTECVLVKFFGGNCGSLRITNKDPLQQLVHRHSHVACVLKIMKVVPEKNKHDDQRKITWGEVLEAVPFYLRMIHGGNSGHVISQLRNHSWIKLDITNFRSVLMGLFVKFGEFNHLRNLITGC